MLCWQLTLSCSSLRNARAALRDAWKRKEELRNATHAQQKQARADIRGYSSDQETEYVTEIEEIEEILS
jgi:hypothetical protein